jgi:hypothetical protein
MTDAQYSHCVNQCNLAIAQEENGFLFDGQKFRIEFRYILGAMANKYGYTATFNDKNFLIIDPK